MSKTKEGVLNFVFDPIDLSELQKILSAAYKSKYALIRIQILEKINSCPPGKSFLIAPADNKNGALSPREIVSFTGSINKALRVERLPWHLVYLPEQKAFAIAPYKRNGARKSPRIDESVSNTKPLNGRVADLFQAATKMFGVSLEDLGTKSYKLPFQERDKLSFVKRTIFYVGKFHLGLKFGEIASPMGIVPSTGWLLYKQASSDPEAKAQAAKLAASIKESK